MRFSSLFLSTLLALNPLWAQFKEPAPAVVTGGDALHLNIVDGPDSAQPHTHSAKGYVFQVTNAAGLPVAGVAVAVRLPDHEPTGRFAGGLRAWVAYSDASGIVRFPVIEWGENGSTELKATAAKGPAHAAVILSQNIGKVAGGNSDVSVVSVAVTPSAKKESPPAAPPAPVVAVAAPIAPKSKPLADVIPVKPAPIQTEKKAPLESSGSNKDAVPASGVAPDSSESKSLISFPPSEQAAIQKPAPPPAPVDVVETLPPPSRPLADLIPPPAASVPPSPGTIAIPNAQSGASAEEPHPLKPEPPVSASESEPAISITNSPTGAGGESHKKVWILVAVGAGAGVGALLAVMGHGNGSNGGGSSAGVTIGSPTISVGPGH